MFLQLGQKLYNMKKKLKKRKKPSTIDSTFFSIFIGEYVEIVARHSLTDTVPLVMEGYLLDMDDDFYYLSDDANSICRAIRKDDLSAIEIANTKTVFDELLKQTPIKENPEDGN